MHMILFGGFSLGKMWKTGCFLRQLPMHLGTTAQTAMAGLVSIGLNLTMIMLYIMMYMVHIFLVTLLFEKQITLIL